MMSNNLPAKPPPTALPARISSGAVDKVIKAVRQGNFLSNAAKLVGVDEATLHIWMTKGKEYNELGPDAPMPSTAPLYRKLHREVTRARANLEAALVSTVAATALDKEDWRAATWFLERSFHKDWSRKSVATIEGNPDNPVQVQVSWAEGLKAALDAGEAEDAIDAEIVDGNEGEPEGDGEGE
jgi:hypothetical protein